MLDIVLPQVQMEQIPAEAPLKPAAARVSPAPRDWSNVVFSVVFCEEARLAYEARPRD